MGGVEEFEVIVVGGGIAGAAVAYFLGQMGIRDVVILEREAQPGTHASGRSAAVLVELHEEPRVRRLINRGARFLRRPPDGFCEAPLLDPVGVLAPATGAALDTLRRTGAALAAEGICVRELAAAEALARVPVLAPTAIGGALLFPDGGHIDVDALLQGYLRHARRAGADLRCGVEVLGIELEGGRCVGVATDRGRLRARWVVDAAGAWAGVVGVMAGAAPIPFQPRRRTAIAFEAPPALDARRWPMVDCDARRVYFKPESGGFLASPMDQEVVAPCDAAPTDEAVADAIDKLEALAPAIVPRALRRRWAGLRTFAPDEVPVVGEDPLRPGFFWLAGQGGVGIETSPALGSLAAALLAGAPPDIDDDDLRALAPGRFC